MNAILLTVAAVAAVNPFRLRGGLPEDSSGRGRLVPVATGTALGLAVLGALAAASGPFLEALEITPETFRIAAGLVAVVAGIASLLRPDPGTEPELPGWRAALWPVAFPRVIAPETAALALTAGSLEGVAPTCLAFALALIILVGLGGLVRIGRTAGVLRRLGGLAALLLVAAGVFLMVDGIRDV
jgi:small neutral amino acid transporter SnatA (MarC family)